MLKIINLVSLFATGDDKGKPAARRGRKAMGLSPEIARLPRASVLITAAFVFHRG
jgi:hypothetical protein